MTQLRIPLFLLLFGAGFATAHIRDTAAIDRPPLSVEVLRQLRFGMVGGTSGGQVTVDSATGRRHLSGAVHDLGGPAGPAKFIVTGEPGRSFRLILPKDRSVSGKEDHRNEALLGRFESTPSAGGVIGPDGRAMITVGATLELEAGQAADTYGATVSLEVLYVSDRGLGAAP